MSYKTHTMDLEPDWKDIVETYVSWLTGESTLVVGDRDEAFDLMIEHFRMLADISSNLRQTHKDQGIYDTSLMPSPKLFAMVWAPTDALS